MGEIGAAFRAAFGLVVGLDRELLAIVALSLQVSLTAAALGFLIGTPIGASIAITRFPGRRGVLVMANALLGLPPVVVGLLVYLLLSRSGPLGSFGLLFTPSAMVIAQVVLTLPIVVALSHRLIEGLWAEYGDALRVDGASLAVSVATLIAMGRAGLVTVFLSAFGRAIAEVGAIIVVGGNIRGHTRTMTTAIALETSRGDLALALGLGLVLVTVTIVVSATAFALGRGVSR
jgi:tungstate transport system permease protein